MDQSGTTYIHETIIVLPGKGIHTHGLLLRGPEPPQVLIQRACGPLHAAATQQGRPLLLSIGYADGRVEHHQGALDGTIHPTDQVPATEDRSPDPVWSQGIPEDTGLLNAVRTAHRAGEWRAAQHAADRATQHLISQHGRNHPYTVMAIELQAHFALMAHDRDTGAALYTDAAVAIHRLGGPRAQSRHNLANAVAAWLHSDRDTSPGGPGFAVAHALIRITPNDRAALAEVLRNLKQDRA
jgi:hypothetical protein